MLTNDNMLILICNKLDDKVYYGILTPIQAYEVYMLAFEKYYSKITDDKNIKKET